MLRARARRVEVVEAVGERERAGHDQDEGRERGRLRVSRDQGGMRGRRQHVDANAVLAAHAGRGLLALQVALEGGERGLVERERRLRRVREGVERRD
jgi:hypothetical protein